MFYTPHKKKKGDTIWWTSEVGTKGARYFSFDQKKWYSLFSDYPRNLTKEQKEIFDKENPFWAEWLEE